MLKTNLLSTVAVGLVVSLAGFSCENFSNRQSPGDASTVKDAAPGTGGSSSGSGGGVVGSGGRTGSGGASDTGGSGETGGNVGSGGSSPPDGGTPDVPVPPVDAGPTDTGSPDAPRVDVGPPAECTAGTKQCNGLQPQTCSAASVWQNAGTACPFVCSAGTCAGTCTPSSKRCSALQPQTCDAAGTWQNTGAACANVCNGGTCAACTPGAKQCNGLQPQTCDTGGLWQNTGTACPFVCAAATGTCTGACVPGAKQCSATQPQTCDTTGAWMNAGAACGACNPCSTAMGACVVATGTACNDGNACTTGETCQSNATCGGGTAVTCTVTNQCQTIGACAPATGCPPAANKGNGTTCNDNNACTGPDTCQSGTCTGAAVTCTVANECQMVGACVAGTGCPPAVNKATGATCSGGKCSGGNCVQCVAKADCSGSGTTCSAQNTCVCDSGAGYHSCGAAASPCYQDTDATHCGSSCTDCRQPNANATCGAGACTNTCVDGAAYTLACPAVAGRPNCSQWTFESTLAGTAGEGWVLLSRSTASAGALSNSTAQASSGSRSLAIPFNNGGNRDKFVEIAVKLCGGGQQVNLNGKTIHWRWRMVPPATDPTDPTASTGYNYLMVHPTGDLTGSGGAFDHNSITDNQWHDMPYDNPSGSVLMDSYGAAAGIGLHLSQTVPYNGVIYIDDFSIR